MNQVIVAKHLKRQFAVKNEEGRNETLTVLNDFNLSVNEGEFLTVLGPSGCGKSTFLNILAGLDKQTSGQIKVEGALLNGVNRNIGVVFQGYALFPWRSVLDNVAAGLEIRGVKKKKRKEIAENYLDRVGLKKFALRYPHELSGGMRQRVAIARALAYNPAILLMDEPFAALDAQTREMLQLELLRIWEVEKKTVLFVTHSIDEAIFLGDRVAVMTSRPAKVKEIVPITLPRNRTVDMRNANEFSEIRKYLWSLIKDEVVNSLQ
ncbi:MULTISPECIES: ABC transporter ATP-binding protein [unclassified Sporolactobacillus]|uniref:ABC transporter ATP-binding protein n=1 Tax=unclassified Sporolactobacillus TaxID=2628533 RepID=UPI00236868E5|nr:ABC transporter ATP-binding protein [Sporolactobacillus sp. CQH2019]MDD9147421.1 ABC transporter ATP-binding protein [Sporolactobacillus sp. CQH2019]